MQDFALISIDCVDLDVNHWRHGTVFPAALRSLERTRWLLVGEIFIALLEGRLGRIIKKK